MCNRFVQKGRQVKPQQKATVLMKGPGGFFELPFEAVFGGAARNESRNYWIEREGAEPVIVPDIGRFGEKDKATGAQNWEDIPPGSALEGLLLPMPPGKDYRLLKVVTQAATEDQIARLGNDRAPIIIPMWCRVDRQEYPPENEAVWTSDGGAVRRGVWSLGRPDIPLTEGSWKDEHSQPLKVSHWLFLGESPNAEPSPPLPNRPSRGGIVGFRSDQGDD